MYIFPISRTSRSCRLFCHLTLKRHSSSKRWQARQLKDHFTKEAVVQGLKSRAAFKLLQIDDKYRVFQSGQTVVDLGYAPGSWSQVAVARTEPDGRVLGVDIIPAQPPKGVSTIQGNFLNPEVQDYVRNFVRDPSRGKPRVISPGSDDQLGFDREMPKGIAQVSTENSAGDKAIERTVDVVLSDMMMNTSGISFKDHVGSMDLCHAALQFSREVLRTGGHFICKYYQGAEEKEFERQLRDLFQRVHRHKPESSRDVSFHIEIVLDVYNPLKALLIPRQESKESYFIGISRK